MEPSDDNPPPSQVADIARLLIEHRATLMGYLVSCVRNHTDAEDLYQEVSLAAIQSADQLRSADGFLPWIREIARRRVLTHYRKSKRLTPIDPELIDRLTETAAEMDGQQGTPARIEALHSCLEALPNESRKLIAMRYEDHQRPVESLAQVFGRSVQATYAILKRSRLLLRKCIIQKMEHQSNAVGS
jgi:RNA polymerase sigma-70 factor (ECF subfamily)